MIVVNFDDVEGRLVVVEGRLVVVEGSLVVVEGSLVVVEGSLVVVVDVVEDDVEEVVVGAK